MNVTVEDITTTKKRLSFVIPGEVINERIRASLENIRKRVKMPGFRQGKVPIKLIEKHYGKEAETEAFDHLLSEYYENAIRDRSIKPVSMPVFEEKIEFKRDEDVKVSLVIEVMPEIEDINYEGIVIEKNKTIVEDKEVDEVLRSLAESKAFFTAMEEPLMPGDLVIMDYFIKDPEIGLENQVFKIGSELYPPEFSNNLEGKIKGDTVEFELTFPEDFRNKELAGKTCSIKVIIKDTKRKIIPEINDEFAKSLNLESLDALKERVKNNILLQKERKERIRQREELLNKLIDRFNFDVPEGLLQEYLDVQLSEQRARNPEDKRSDEELKGELMESVLRRVKGDLLMDIIGERENISLNEDDIKNYIMDISERLLLNPEFVVKYYMADAQRQRILRKGAYQVKVLETILNRIGSKEHVS